MPADPDAASPVHFLLAGDASDLPLIQRMLHRLPVDAYGQVFVEVTDPSTIQELDAPRGMSVTWLHDDATPTHMRGRAVAQAIVAWVAEWVPTDDAAFSPPYVMWVGCSTTTIVDQLHDYLGDRLGRLHLHHGH